MAGILIIKPLIECSLAELKTMKATHFLDPINLLTNLHRDLMEQRRLRLDTAYHLVTIASTSSYRRRDNETLYSALKTAKAHFIRNFAPELVRDLPGSKCTLLNPGGIATGLFGSADQDTSPYLQPDMLARVIWDMVQGQKTPFTELQMLCDEKGLPVINL